MTEGSLISRYGKPQNGRYGSPAGTPIANRALPPNVDLNNHHIYMVKAGKSVSVHSGIMAPYYAQPGGGIQYYFHEKTIEQLLKDGDIIEVFIN